MEIFLKTSQGIKNLPAERANQLASEDPVRIKNFPFDKFIFLNILGLWIARSLQQY
jgi:hypothetical protein